MTSYVTNAGITREEEKYLFAFDFRIEWAGVQAPAAYFTLQGVRTDKDPRRDSQEYSGRWVLHPGDNEVRAELLSEIQETPSKNETTNLTHALPVQQDPSHGSILPTRLDIVEQYILDNIRQSQRVATNSTSNSTGSLDHTRVERITKKSQNHHLTTRNTLLKRDPLKCSSENECVDGSCCNKVLLSYSFHI